MLDTTDGGWSCSPRNLDFFRRKVMKNLFRRLWQEEEGQDLTEYALLLVLIALAATVAMKGLASAISNTFSTAASNLTANS
jgi:pilus assembly protein Flp/PilA